MVKANNFHHLAISTADTKRQLEFFSDVLGLELVALFPMHNVEGAFHCFLKLNEKSCMSFVQLEQNANIETVEGVTYVGSAGQSAPGTIQHFALNVDSELELLNMRDRIRSKGFHVFGPLDHGIMRSIYFSGPDNLSLEISTWVREVVPDAWIDPEVVKSLNISDEELTRLRNPAPYKGEGGAVAQPPVDPIKNRNLFENKKLKAVIEMSDKDVFEKLSTPNDPVAL